MGSKFSWGSVIMLTASVVSSGCSMTNLWPNAELPSFSPDRSSVRHDRPSKNRDSDPMADGKLATARLAEKRGHSERATQIYRELVKEDPEHFLALHRLGVIAASDGRYEKAHDFFARARKVRPNDPKLLSDVGYAYYLQHRLDESEALLRKALKIKPNHVSATNNLALVLGEQGQFEESLAMFKNVNDTAEAHSNMAYVYTQMGQLDKAEKEYSKALSLNPKLRTSAEAMIQVASKRKQVEHYQAVAAAKKKARAESKDLDSEDFDEESALAEDSIDQKPSISRKSLARLKAMKKLRALEEEHAMLVASVEEIDEEEIEETQPVKRKRSAKRPTPEKSDSDSAWAKLARSLGSGATRSGKKASVSKSRKLQRPTIQQTSASEPIEEDAAEENSVEEAEVTEEEDIQLTGFHEDDAPAPPATVKHVAAKDSREDLSGQSYPEPGQQEIRRPVPVNRLREGSRPDDMLRSADPASSSVLPEGRLQRADEISDSTGDRISLNTPGGPSVSRMNQLRLR